MSTTISNSDINSHAGNSISSGTITTSDLHRLRSDDPGIRILDVRTGGEFETAHIPGSYNVPLDTLAEHARDLANVSHPVVLVCQSGARATQAHAKLESAGKGGLHILEGGMAAWESSGGDVTRGENERWAMDRQVRLVAGSLTLTGILASLVFPPAKWFAGAIGAGLTFSAVSNTCAMARVLGKLPYNKGQSCDIDGVLNQLNG